MLEDPKTEGVDLRVEVLEALKGPHCKSPAFKNADSLERFLENIDDLNMQELYGLLTATSESVDVPKNLHERCYIAIASYMTRCAWFFIYRLTIKPPNVSLIFPNPPSMVQPVSKCVTLKRFSNIALQL